jgi:hypothetical protein
MASPVARRLGTLALGCAWLAAGATAGGCVTPTQDRQDTLVRVAREYNDGLRWRRTEQVAPHLPADEVAVFLKRLDDLGDDFEMADYEVKAITFTDAGEGADVTVDFTWYNQARALVRHTVVAQRWALRGGRWLCIKQVRTRGDRFPLVPEPMGAGAPSAAAP